MAGIQIGEHFNDIVEDESSVEQENPPGIYEISGPSCSMETDAAGERWGTEQRAEFK